MESVKNLNTKIYAIEFMYQYLFTIINPISVKTQSLKNSGNIFQKDLKLNRYSFTYNQNFS